MHTDNSALELVNRIGLMMEYMTLCADPTLFLGGKESPWYPAPSGVPMGIVTLPDFVVDVAVEKLASAPDASPAEVTARTRHVDVGGRSGRLALLLQWLDGERKGWYSVKYVAKATSLGRVVLERQFDPDTPHAISLRYIIDADDDWIHVYEKRGRDTFDSKHANLGVTREDVVKSQTMQLGAFTDVRYIVIGSKSGRYANDALATVTKALTMSSDSLRQRSIELPIGVLLDLSTLEKQEQDEAARSLVQGLINLRNAASAYDITATVLCDEVSTEKIAIDSGSCDYILMRGSVDDDSGVTIQLKHPDGTILSSSHMVPMERRPFSREALTVGYVLASASDLGWRLLRKWFAYCPQLRPIDGTPHDGPPVESADVNPTVQDALLLPSLTNTDLDPVSPEDRLKFATLFAHFIHRQTDLAFGQAEPENQLSYRCFLKEQERLANDPGLHDRLEDGASSDTSPSTQDAISTDDFLRPRFPKRERDRRGVIEKSLFIPPSDVAGFAALCDDRDRRFELHQTDSKCASIKPITKAIMFDLDATLIDSGGMRRVCWSKGLHAFFREAVGDDIALEHVDTLVGVYETFVYNNYRQFRELLRDSRDIPHELQPCDFRQVWNHEYAWSSLLWVTIRASELSSGDFPEPCDTKSIWESRVTTLAKALANHGTKCEEGHDTRCDICKPLKPILDVRHLDLRSRRKHVAEFRDVLRHYRVAIQEGIHAFWDVDYPCYPQVRPCVEMLRSVDGCQVYVVTEGHEITQRKKLECTGLSDLFPRGRVLSTGAASAPEDASVDLKKLRQFEERVMEDLQGLKAVEGNVAREVIVDEDIDSRIDEAVEVRRAAIGTITFLSALLDALYQKAHARFYSAVIDAIRLNPDAPAHVLQSFLVRRKSREDDATFHFDKARAPNLSVSAASVDADDASSVRHRPGMKFFMIGDRYDNDCKPLIKMRFSGTERVSVGTCRLLSGRRSWDDHPPKRELPSTTLVCDTLAQVGYILQQDDAWQGIQELAHQVTPPVLLDQNDGMISYTENNGPRKIADRFSELALARVDDTLIEERAVQEMLDQVERDLAVCDDQLLSDFYDAQHTSLGEWWKQANDRRLAACELAVKKLSGALIILDGINWWRHKSGLPLLQRGEDSSHTLEWILGGQLLRCIERSTIRLRLHRSDEQLKHRTLVWCDQPPPTGLDFRSIIDALPYSDLAYAIVRTACNAHPDVDFERCASAWLERASALPWKTSCWITSATRQR